jgi:flavin-dependent dehydrogenase
MGLARLGHRVIVVAAPRRFDTTEGIARRALDWLRHNGFTTTFDSIAERDSFWNGEHSRTNGEHLVSRSDFDRALIADLTGAGVTVRHTRVRSFSGPSTELADGAVLRARLVVDARGRTGNRAPLSGRQQESTALRGPPTLSVAQTWTGPVTEPATAVFAFDEGWGWLARRADGIRVTQLTVGADTPELRQTESLTAWLRGRIAGDPIASAWVSDCEPRGAAIARASTALFRAPWNARERTLRVGDAAMAVDPLSGNGIFQALSSASVAPAVINTLLRDERAGPLALDFYRDRCRHLFERFARIGRDFYRSETRWRDRPFWQARSAWPDDEPAHDRRNPTIECIAKRPVVEEGFIHEREVVITDDQPLGVWRVADVEVAPLVRELGTMSQQERRARLQASAPELSAWCRRVGLVAYDQTSRSGDRSYR